MPGEISRTYDGPGGPGPGVPPWIHEVAGDIAGSLPLWTEQAERVAEIERDADAAEDFLFGRIEAAILTAWQTKRTGGD